VKLLAKKNYMMMVESLAKGEVHMFRNFYAEVDGQEKDILNDGKLSCGRVLSAILYLNKMIGDTHATVEGTVKDMIDSSWYEIGELKEGAVILWEKQNGHSHIGFYIGNNEAVSNDSNGTGFPWKHHFTYNNTREIDRIYFHTSLQ
jgi:hypothetical protein